METIKFEHKPRPRMLEVEFKYTDIDSVYSSEPRPNRKKDMCWGIYVSRFSFFYSNDL